MSDINYEQEVKKVYPYAYGQFMRLGRDYFLIVDGYNEELEGSESLSEVSGSQDASWKSAYERLKQQGKL